MRQLVCVVSLAAAVLTPSVGDAQAPRARGGFVNPAGPRLEAGPLTMAPFFLRRAWATWVPRPGAAVWVPHDPVAIAHNPSVTWVGHATMLVRMDGITFLTDPMFSERASPFRLVGPRRHQPPGVPLDALPAIDFALLSHDHYDHTDTRSIAALAQRGTRFIVPLGLGAIVRDAGGEPVDLDWWESVPLGPVTIHCVPAQHFSGRGLMDGGRRLWAGWVVVGPSRRYYHAGDTGYFSGFAEIGERLGPIDLAAVPIGAYEPPEIMRFVHLNPEEAARAAADVRARQAIGMHWGTFDLSDEPLDEPPVRFHRAAGEVGLAGRVWTLAVGETRPW